MFHLTSNHRGWWIPSQPSQNGSHKEQALAMMFVCICVCERKEPLHITGRNVNYSSCCENQYGGSKPSWTYHTTQWYHAWVFAQRIQASEARSHLPINFLQHFMEQT